MLVPLKANPRQLFESSRLTKQLAEQTSILAILAVNHSRELHPVVSERVTDTAGLLLTFSSPDKSGLLFSSLLNFCFLAGTSFPAWDRDSDMALFSLILAQTPPLPLHRRKHR